MTPGQEEAVEVLAHALLGAWVNCGLIQSGGLQAYPRDQQPRLLGEARFQARSLLGAWSKPLTADDLRHRA